MLSIPLVIGVGAALLGVFLLVQALRQDRELPATGAANKTTLIATPSSGWYGFLVAGAGMGCVFPPMTTVAMRDIEPQAAGAASGPAEHQPPGRIRDRRRRGGCVAAEQAGRRPPSQARQRSVGLPAPIRDKLVAGVTRAALWFLGDPSAVGMHAGTFTFTAASPGSYRYLCPVPGHAGRGMTGVFTVTASG